MTLARFPRRTLRGDRTIYRIHRSANGAWWFSSDGTGRFDPVGTGKGACYLAEQPLGAWIEVFSVAIGRDLRLANLASRRALEFGVTATLGAGEDYTQSQAFAAQAVDAGFDGIRHLVRHDPSQHLYGIALFGAPGADPDWPGGDDGPIEVELAADARAAFGYRVVPLP